MQLILLATLDLTFICVLFSDCAIKEPTQAAKNMEDAKRLWEISEKLVQLTSIYSETKTNE